MSWSASFLKPQPKESIDSAIDSMAYPQNADPSSVEYRAGLAQFAEAKKAAKSIAAILPGPFLMVNLNGHANAVGWQEKSGYANDCISISVTQMTKD